MPDPADIALDRAALSALLARTQPETRYILGRIAQGATYREIADDLRWSVGAVTPRPRRSPTTSRAGGRRHTTAREGRP
ncbi:hypothetical protein [Actinoplanes xinjiangensis]|uniref:hypothetical protein n=1 Tax=Actinoplanes xinjiangensis TaxID=512350 RepID=UPI00343AA46E